MQNRIDQWKRMLSSRKVDPIVEERPHVMLTAEHYDKLMTVIEAARNTTMYDPSIIMALELLDYYEDTE